MAQQLLLIDTTTGAITAVSSSPTTGVLASNGSVWALTTSPSFNQVKDSGGALALYLPAVANSVNYIEIDSGVTGTGPTIYAWSASDTNVDLLLATKGTGVVKANGDTVLTLTAAQSPTNKTLNNTNTVTLKDTLFLLQDAADTTKQVQLDVAGGQTTGTTRTITFPQNSGTIATLAGSETFSTKRIQPRVTSAASASSLTPSVATADIYAYTALAAALTINAPTGTPVDGERIRYRFKDNGTARALTWNATFRIVGTTLPTTTVISKVVYVDTIYNAAETVWDVIDVKQQA
jgi:hypothetical protein